MKKVVSEIREKDVAQLYKEVDAIMTQMRELRFRHAHREVTDTTKIRKLKRQIARILTIIQEKEIAQLAAK